MAVTDEHEIPFAITDITHKRPKNHTEIIPASPTARTTPGTGQFNLLRRVTDVGATGRTGRREWKD